MDKTVVRVVKVFEKDWYDSQEILKDIVRIFFFLCNYEEVDGEIQAEQRQQRKRPRSGRSRIWTSN